MIFLSAMKKFTRSLLALILTVNLSACSLWGADEAEKKAAENKAQPNAFNFDYPTEEKSLSYFTENDTAALLVASSPYYMGRGTLDLPAFKQYEKLRGAKVAEALKLTAELTTAAKKLKTDLEPFKGAFFGLAETAIAEDEQYKKFFQESGGSIMEHLVKEETLLVNIETIDENPSTDPYVAALFDYQKTVLALALTETIYKDFANLFANATTAAELLAANENSNIKEALAIFNAQMEKVSALNGTFDEIAQKTAHLQTALKQLTTGDYYFAQAGLAFVNEKLPEIKKMATELAPTADLDAENIQTMQDYIAIFEVFTGEMKTEMENIAKEGLITPETTEKTFFGLIAIAQAEVASATVDLLQKANDTFQQAPTATPSTLATAGDLIKAGASWTWSGIKEGFNKAKTGAGVTLDTAGALTKSGFDVIFGAANGNSVSEITGEIKGNFKKVKDNYDKDLSGAEIIKTAGEYLEAVEDAPGQAIEGVVGKGWTSWAAGGITKITVGMFTGLGKGMYKIANKQSTAGEIAEGMLDVGLSLIGGTKTIFKGLSAEGKEGFKMFGQKAVNYVKMVANKLDREQLKTLTKEILKKAKLTPSEVLSLITNSLELEGKELVAAELKAISQGINEKFTTLLKDGLANILKNAKGAGATVGETYKGFVKDTFEKSLSGLKEAMLKTLGEGYEDYVDNLITSKMDDFIKAAIKVYIDAAKYDGVYHLNHPLGEGYVLPIHAVIENGALTAGSAELAISREGWTITIKMTAAEGAVGEGGKITGKWEGVITASGPSSTFWLFEKPANVKECTDHLRIDGSGDLTGNITESGLTFTMTGSGTPSGTFFCEPITTGTQAIDEPKSYTLRRVQ